MKRKLRVLLFAGGPTREYQFLRTLLYREVIEKRLDMSVYLQSGKEDLVDQDVESERLLHGFPNKIGADDAGEKYMSFSDYDVIIAVDPDWLVLEPAQMKLFREWVSIHYGGLVFVGGPVATFQACPAGRQGHHRSSDAAPRLPQRQPAPWRQRHRSHDTSRPLRSPLHAVGEAEGLRFPPPRRERRGREHRLEPLLLGSRQPAG